MRPILSPEPLSGPTGSAQSRLQDGEFLGGQRPPRITGRRNERRPHRTHQCCARRRYLTAHGQRRSRAKTRAPTKPRSSPAGASSGGSRFPARWGDIARITSKWRSRRLELPARQEGLCRHVEEARRAHHVLEPEGPPSGQHVGGDGLGREDSRLDEVPLT
jgi:hypothetical protein